VVLAHCTVGAEAGSDERTEGVGGGSVAWFVWWGGGHGRCFCCDDGVGDDCARWIWVGKERNERQMSYMQRILYIETFARRTGLQDM